MIIEFGRWQLRPVDNRNWALATTEQWEKAASNRGKGQMPSSARYYQWPNIGYAVHYAASRDLMDKPGVATPWEAAEELTRTCDALLAQCCHSLANYSDPATKTPSRAMPRTSAGK